MKLMVNVEDSEFVDNHIGHESRETCPKCGEFIWVSKSGDKWCSGLDCTWSNNEGLTQFLEKIKKD